MATVSAHGGGKPRRRRPRRRRLLLRLVYHNLKVVFVVDRASPALAASPAPVSAATRARSAATSSGIARARLGDPRLHPGERAQGPSIFKDDYSFIKYDVEKGKDHGRQPLGKGGSARCRQRGPSPDASRNPPRFSCGWKATLQTWTARLPNGVAIDASHPILQKNSWNRSWLGLLVATHQSPRARPAPPAQETDENGRRRDRDERRVERRRRSARSSRSRRYRAAVKSTTTASAPSSGGRRTSWRSAGPGRVMFIPDAVAVPLFDGIIGLGVPQIVRVFFEAPGYRSWKAISATWRSRCRARGRGPPSERPRGAARRSARAT